MELRPYQIEAVRKVEGQAEQWGQTLLVMATGCGKTVVMAELARREVERGGRVLVVAHRKELLDQARDKFKRSGVPCDIWRGRKKEVPGAPCLVASVQGMQHRLKWLSPSTFTLVMVDEAHHGAASTYKALLDHFADAKRVGVTATPQRGDGKSLFREFGSIAFQYGISEAVRDGYLVPFKVVTPELDIALDGVRVTAGELDAYTLADRLKVYFPKIAQAMLDAGCRDRQCVVFLPLVSIAQEFAHVLEAHGFACGCVDGSMPGEERERQLRDFEQMRTNVLCNAMLLTEGWDCPRLDCVVPLRPTCSQGLYTQMVGRGTRLFPGKADCLVLDFTFLHEQAMAQNMATAVMGLEGDEAQAAHEAGGTLEEMAEAAARAKLSAEAALARRLAEVQSEKRRRDTMRARLRNVDPDRFAGMRRDGDEMTRETASAMKGFGFRDIDIEDMTETQGRFLMQTRGQRPTEKQMVLLRRFGFKNVETWKPSQAKPVIAVLGKDKDWKNGKARFTAMCCKPEEYDPDKWVWS